MRYRFARPSDFGTFYSMLEPGFRPSPRVRNKLVNIWRTLSADGDARIVVIEDPELPEREALQAVAAGVFARDDFIQQFLLNPHPGLTAEVYEDFLAGRSPVLTRREVSEANARDGLNLVMLHFALRNRDLSDPRVQEVMFAVNAAFFFFYGGYRLKTAMQEVYGRQAADYMQAGGFHIFDDFGAKSAGDATPTADLHPYLLLMRKEEVQPSAVNPLSFLFYPSQPRIGFSLTEQGVVERALLNESDFEISQHLGVSPDAIKKTWRRVYDRASKTVPHLFAGSDAGISNARGHEKRRYLLEYVRVHLEELRPYRR